MNSRFKFTEGDQVALDRAGTDAEVVSELLDGGAETLGVEFAQEA